MSTPPAVPDDPRPSDFNPVDVAQPLSVDEVAETTDPTVTEATHPPKSGPLGHLLDNPAIERFDAQVEGLADLLRGSPLADRIFYGLSAVGDHGMIWHGIGLTRAGLKHETLRDAVERSAALGVEALLLNGPIKWLFRRRRPVATEERPIHLRTPRTSSFPSGHSSSGIFAAMLVAQRTRVKWPWYVLGVAIGWSRVHVRIHHPSDVIGGFFAGWLMGKVGVAVLKRVDR